MIGLCRALSMISVLILALPGPAGAATLHAPLPYSGLYAFGDSLTDNGNAYRLSGGRTPKSPPYFDGRYSNGPVWYDHVAAVFRAQDLETLNYAVGGAKARNELFNVNTLRNQRRLFVRTANPGPDPLAAVWAGGNDVMDRVGRSSLSRVAREAADAVVANTASLFRNGVNTALVFNLPDLADIPRYLGASDSRRASATRGSTTFNTRLASGIESLRTRGMTVIEVDVFTLYKDVVANPAAYGITNLTTPCLQGGVNVCTPEEEDAAAFFDRIHPGATLHAHLADHVLGLISPTLPPVLASLLGNEAASDGPGAYASAAGTRVAPVPLPAPALGLLAALAGLGLLARRRGSPNRGSRA